MLAIDFAQATVPGLWRAGGARAGGGDAFGGSRQRPTRQPGGALSRAFGGGEVHGQEGIQLHRPGTRRRPVPRDRDRARQGRRAFAARGRGGGRRGGPGPGGRTRCRRRDRRSDGRPCRRRGDGRRAARLSVRPLPHQGKGGRQAEAGGALHTLRRPGRRGDGVGADGRRGGGRLPRPRPGQRAAQRAVPRRHGGSLRGAGEAGPEGGGCSARRRWPSSALAC